MERAAVEGEGRGRENLTFRWLHPRPARRVLSDFSGFSRASYLVYGAPREHVNVGALCLFTLPSLPTRHHLVSTSSGDIVDMTALKVQPSCSQTCRRRNAPRASCTTCCGSSSKSPSSGNWSVFPFLPLHPRYPVELTRVLNTEALQMVHLPIPTRATPRAPRRSTHLRRMGSRRPTARRPARRKRTLARDGHVKSL